MRAIRNEVGEEIDGCSVDEPVSDRATSNSSNIHGTWLMLPRLGKLAESSRDGTSKIR